MRVPTRRPFLLCLPLLAACATTAPRQVPPPNRPTTEVELTVKDVEPELLEQLQAGMAKVAELRTAKLKSHSGKTAVFTILYTGNLDDLPGALSQVPNPGLRFGAASYKVEYAAFDNQPPTVAFVFPQAEQVLTAREQHVTVEVPDKDLAGVVVNGAAAPQYKGNVYRLKVTLAEGRNELVAVAKDKAGNESTAKVAVVVDTTPPAVNATIKLVVEGSVEPGSSVLIDGQEIAVGGDGRYKAEVPVRKGQRSVEIVAIDKSGNKTVSKKDIGQ